MSNLVISRATQMVVAPPVEAVVSLFDGAPELPDGNLLLQHDLDTTAVLKRIGFKLPSPMACYYDFGSPPPFDVQIKTCEMLTEQKRAYVLSAMGTGKTRTVLWAWDYLNKIGKAKRLLVVAPLSTLNFTWKREIFAVLPHRKAVVVHGTKKQRLEALAQDVDIYIINHDGIKTILEALKLCTELDTLVLDELAVYRNNSDRFKIMRKFAQNFAYVWGLTGAPMPNSPVDVWSQTKIITPWTSPSHQGSAKRMLMEQVSQYVWVPKRDAVAQAFNMMQPSVRFSLDDVVELPEGSVQTIDVDKTDQQIEVYKTVATDLKAMIEDKTITAMNAGAALNKLLQIAGGWVYTQNPEYVEIDVTPRLNKLLEVIEGVQNKVIIFVPYKHMLHGIAAFLKDQGYEPAVIDGDTSRTEREEIFGLFQNTKKYPQLLAHPATISHGLTLTAADTIVWWTPITSLDIYDQANARIRRVGQMHKQLVLHFQAFPVEHKLYRMLKSKQKTQNEFLALIESATDSIS